MKDSISFEITSCVGKIGIFNHIKNDIWLDCLSQKVIEMNPTNLGVSDVSLVATTLDTNNAMKFMSGIEGMDRFGTGPRLYGAVKPLVIDLELAA